MAKNKERKSKDSVRGHRFKKQGGQSGGPGYNQRTDGNNHGSREK